MASISRLAGRPRSAVVRVITSDPVEDRNEDALLVAAVRAAAPGAPARVWDRYAGVARRILRRMLGPGVDVEDALQEVFLRLFRDLGSLREPSALRSFLIGITVHVATSELRRRKARRWLLLSDDGKLPNPEPLTDAHRLEERRALHALYRLLDRLGTTRRVVFVLRYIDGLELSELSVVLGCSLATTKRRAADAAKRVCELAARDPVLSSYVRSAP